MAIIRMSWTTEENIQAWWWKRFLDWNPIGRMVVGLLLIFPVPGLCEETAMAGEEGKEQEIVVTKNAKISEIGIETTERDSIRRLVNQTLADQPEGAKARVTLRFLFSNHPHHYGVNAYPYAVVALDEKGEPNGLERFYSVGAGGGGLLRTLPWKNGKPHGEETIYEDGRVKTTIPWVDGQVHGTRKTFYPDGKVQVEASYEAGDGNGLTRTYDRQGRVMSEVSMKQGKRHGSAKDFWPESGRVSREIPYDMGQVVGSMKEYYASGKLKRELPFQDNSMHGIEVLYEADGREARRRYWINGEQISASEFTEKFKP